MAKPVPNWGHALPARTKTFGCISYMTKLTLSEHYTFYIKQNFIEGYKDDQLLEDLSEDDARNNYSIRLKSLNGCMYDT